MPMAAALAAGAVGYGGAVAAGATGMEALSMGSMAMSGVGQMMTANAQSQSAQYNSEIQANNAVLMRQNATMVSQEGDIKAQQIGQETKARVGAMESNMAASGVDVNSGSSIDVRSSAAQMGELNAISVRSNAAKSAYKNLVGATSDQAKSQLDQYQAGQDMTAGEIGATTTVLGGVSNPLTGYPAWKSSNSLWTGSANHGTFWG